MNSKITAVIFKDKNTEFLCDKLFLNWEAKYCELGFETHIFDVHEKSDINKILSKCGNYDVIVLFGVLTIDLSSLSIYDNNKILFAHESQKYEDIANNILMKFFIENSNHYNKTLSNELFSVITPTYNTPIDFLNRAYNSLCKQTYNNWEWFILDDSSNDKVIEHLKSINDPRIRILSNVTNNGNVGYNKQILGMSSKGEYILELDHDDELTNDCLETLLKAFKTYPEGGFAYSNCLELSKSGDIDYGDNWGRGQGGRYTEKINGDEHIIMDTPDINCISIRSIISCPNHVRCWRKSVYTSIYGHNSNLSIMDDFDLIIRTFIITKFIKIKKTLYIQHREHETTQNIRNKEIQRLDYLLRIMYDKRIHNRIIELGDENSDICWDETTQSSYINNIHKKPIEKFNFVY